VKYIHEKGISSNSGKKYISSVDFFQKQHKEKEKKPEMIGIMARASSMPELRTYKPNNEKPVPSTMRHAADIRATPFFASLFKK